MTDCDAFLYRDSSESLTVASIGKCVSAASAGSSDSRHAQLQRNSWSRSRRSESISMVPVLTGQNRRPPVSSRK